MESSMIRCVIMRGGTSKALFLRDTGDWPLLATVQKINDPTQEFTVIT